jgi:hypothetical protein
MSIHKIVTGIVGLVAVIALVASLSESPPSQIPQDMAGEIRNFGAAGVGIFQKLIWHFGTGIRIGDNDASLVKEIIHTTCNLSTKQLPLEASSTDTFYCTVPGVRSGDKVEVSLPNYDFDKIENGALGYFLVTGAKASTTDVIDVAITNLFGQSTSSFPQATTSADVTITRYSN